MNDVSKRFRDLLFHDEQLGLTLDVSRIRFEEGFFERTAPMIQGAFEAMDALEGGSIANPDEGRRVGHYWLRAPELAPEPSMREAIEASVEGALAFAASVHKA